MAIQQIYAGSGAAIDLEYTVTQDIASNRSTITAKAYVRRTNSSYYGYRNGVNFALSLALGADKTTSNISWTFNLSNCTVGQRYFIGTVTKTVTHNADGTQSAITASAYCATGTVSLGTINGSLSIALATIPRASSPTISTSSFALGAYPKMTFNRKSTTFKHAVYVSWAGRSGWIGSSGNPQATKTYFSGDDITFYLPREWATALTSSTAAVANIDVYTYDANNVQIGNMTRIRPTVAIPTDIVPTVSAPTATYSNTLTGTNVQSISTATIKITASGASGSTIKSYSATFDGKTYTGSSFVVPLLNSGTRRLKVTVTDTRGRTASSYMDIVVVAYTPPKISVFTATRNGTTPTTVATISKGSIASISTKNRLTAYIEYRQTGTTTAPIKYMLADNQAVTALNSTASLTGIDAAKGYDLTLVVKDLFRTASSTIKISTTSVPINAHPNRKSVGIGKMASGTYALEVGGKTRIEDEMTVTGLARFGSGLDVNGGWGTFREPAQFLKGIGPQVIPANANLNTYTASNRGVGFYYTPASADAATMLNCPTQNAFSLLVERHAGTKQTLTQYHPGNPRTWIRNYYNDVWGEWYSVSMIRDVTGAMLVPGLSQGFTKFGGVSYATHYWIDGRAVTVMIQLEHEGTTQGFKTPFGTAAGYRPLTAVRFPMRCGNRIEYGTIGLDGLIKFWTEAGEKSFIGQVTFLV